MNDDSPQSSGGFIESRWVMRELQHLADDVGLVVEEFGRVRDEPTKNELAGVGRAIDQMQRRMDAAVESFLAHSARRGGRPLLQRQQREQQQRRRTRPVGENDDEEEDDVEDKGESSMATEGEEGEEECEETPRGNKRARLSESPTFGPMDGDDNDNDDDDGDDDNDRELEAVVSSASSSSSSSLLPVVAPPPEHVQKLLGLEPIWHQIFEHLVAVEGLSPGTAIWNVRSTCRTLACHVKSFLRFRIYSLHGRGDSMLFFRDYLSMPGPLFIQPSAGHNQMVIQKHLTLMLQCLRWHDDLVNLARFVKLLVKLACKNRLVRLDKKLATKVARVASRQKYSIPTAVDILMKKSHSTNVFTLPLSPYYYNKLIEDLRAHGTVRRGGPALTEEQCQILRALPAGTFLISQRSDFNLDKLAKTDIVRCCISTLLVGVFSSSPFGASYGDWSSIRRESIMEKYIGPEDERSEYEDEDDDEFLFVSAHQQHVEQQLRLLPLYDLSKFEDCCEKTYLWPDQSTPPHRYRSPMLQYFAQMNSYSFPDMVTSESHSSTWVRKVKQLHRSMSLNNFRGLYRLVLDFQEFSFDARWMFRLLSAKLRGLVKPQEIINFAKREAIYIPMNMAEGANANAKYYLYSMHEQTEPWRGNIIRGLILQWNAVDGVMAFFTYWKPVNAPNSRAKTSTVPVFYLEDKLRSAEGAASAASEEPTLLRGYCRVGLYGFVEDFANYLEGFATTEPAEIVTACANIDPLNFMVAPPAAFPPALQKIVAFVSRRTVNEVAIPRAAEYPWDPFHAYNVGGQSKRLSGVTFCFDVHGIDSWPPRSAVYSKTGVGLFTLFFRAMTNASFVKNFVHGQSVMEPRIFPTSALVLEVEVFIQCAETLWRPDKLGSLFAHCVHENQDVHFPRCYEGGARVFAIRRNLAILKKYLPQWENVAGDPRKYLNKVGLMTGSCPLCNQRLANRLLTHGLGLHVQKCLHPIYN